MSEVVEAAQGPSILEDPQAWLNAEREKAEAAQPPEPEAPEAPEVQPPAPAAEAAAPEPAAGWRDAPIPDDVAKDYRFFAGKKTGDLFDSYRNIVTHDQEQGRRVSQLEAELAAAKTFKEMAQVVAPKPPAPDPYEGFDPNVDPVVRPKEWAEFQERRLEARAREIATQTYTDAELKREAENVGAALSRVQAKTGLDNDSFQRFVPGIVDMTHRKLGRSGLVSDEALLGSFREMAQQAARSTEPQPLQATPQPEPEKPAPPPAPAANPPGAKRTAAQAEVPKSGGPTLRAEQAQILRARATEWANQMGYSDEVANQFYETAASKLAGGASK